MAWKEEQWGKTEYMREGEVGRDKRLSARLKAKVHKLVKPELLSALETLALRKQSWRWQR